MIKMEFVLLRIIQAAVIYVKKNPEIICKNKKKQKMSSW